MHRWHLSGDRKWLLWEEVRPESSKILRVAGVEIGGSRAVRWLCTNMGRGDSDGASYWTDVDAGAGWDRFEQLRWHPQSVKVVNFRLDSAAPAPPRLLRDSAVEARKLWRLANRQLMKLSNGFGPRGFELTEYDLSTPDGSPKVRYVNARPDAQLFDLALSPRKDRFAWLMGWYQPPPGAAWFQSIFAQFGARGRYVMAVWTTDLSGKDAREIRVLDGSPWTGGSLAWSPSGSHLSFRVKDTLWVTPVR